jgi:hypothetical protein
MLVTVLAMGGLYAFPATAPDRGSAGPSIWPPTATLWIGVRVSCTPPAASLVIVIDADRNEIHCYLPKMERINLIVGERGDSLDITKADPFGRPTWKKRFDGATMRLETVDVKR